MRRCIPILAVSLLVVACESRADKIKRLCSAYLASADGSVFQKELKAEIYEISGGLKAGDNVWLFCSRYLGS